jgi:hypothetical protein
MALPGFNAEISLYRTGVQYRSIGALIQAGIVMPQLFCRATDCPCLIAKCREAGGTVVPDGQPPCYYECELKPGCTCMTGETCCNPETNFCCPPGETCCNPETEFCCPSGATCCSNPQKDSCCSPGQLCCDPANNSCADIKTDPSNCGSCGKACGPGQTCVNGQCVASPQLSVSYRPPQPPEGQGFPGTLSIEGQNFAADVDVTLTICNCDLDPYQLTVHTSPGGPFTPGGSFTATPVTCNCGPGGNGLPCNGPPVINQAIVMVTAQDALGNTLASGSAANPC